MCFLSGHVCGRLLLLIFLPWVLVSLHRWLLVTQPVFTEHLSHTEDSCEPEN